MAEAITASYVERDDDWTVTVAGVGEERTEHAPGIIAARDTADQLIDSLKPEDGEAAVVHLLNGSALEFTTAYMTARLSRTESGADLTAADHPIPEQAVVAEAVEQSTDDEADDGDDVADDIEGDIREDVEDKASRDATEPANAG